MYTGSFGLLVTGSRGICDYEDFSSRLDVLLSDVPQWDIHIITGDSVGVDQMARRYAEENNLELHMFYAMWNVHGKTAGMQRNISMFKFLIENFQHPGCFIMTDDQEFSPKQAINLARYWKVPLRIGKPRQRQAPVRVQAPEKTFVSAPKWFQDDPDISNYDKYLIRHQNENIPVNRDPRDEARSRTVYVEESDYTKRKRRAKLLMVAAHLATINNMWAE